ncbi:MAG: TonB-dependent receptor, partial [Flavobacteriia bacterium]
MNYDYLTRVVLFFVVLFLTISIQAQTAVLDTINPINLDEIVINASKNNLKIKELPAAVSVIHNTVIEHESVVKMSDLTSLSPNFYMPDYGSKLTSPIYIRGIGSRINAPSVGLYVDHVPYFEKSAFQFDFFDIEKVEILRGPQGTLYGRNTMGGIINILTLSPDKYQGTKFKSSIGNYGQYGFNAGYYKRINQQWSTSVSGNFVHNDGFFTNEFSDSTVDKTDSYGLRHRLKFKPSKRFDIENIAAFENSTQGGYPYAVYDTATKTTSPVNYDRYSSYDRTLFSDALHLNYSTDHWKLSNTASFQLLNDEQNIDQDFSPENLYYITQFQDQKTVSNELLVQSVNSGRYSWLLGVFGFNQAFDNKVNVNLYTHDMEYLKTFDKSIRGAAVFHQSTLKVTDKFSVVAGIRYDYEQSELHYLYEGAMAGVTLPPQDTIYPHLKEGVLLPKIALNYQRDHMSVYASYSSGYKPGGFNTTFERPEHLTFNNELSNSYELGLKATIFKDKLSTEFSIFYNYLKNQQIYNTVPSGHGSYLSNAGKS